MKRVFTTLTTLAIGGFIGSEYQKKWKNNYVYAAGPIVPNRSTEIMKYGFPSSNNIKVNF